MSRHPSPLRYPGGKGRLAEWLGARMAEQAGPMDIEIWIEPFAGGAGAAISLLQQGIAAEAWIAEADPGLAAFWRVLTDDDEGRWLIDQVEHLAPTLELFDAAIAQITDPDGIPERDLALSAFVANRCSRSGIIAPGAGPIGGRAQNGRYRIDDRFHGPRLAARLRAVHRLRGRLRLIGTDGIALIEQLPASGVADEVFVFADPPYIGDGPRLYRNPFGLAEHERLAGSLLALDGPWIATYDDHDRIPGLYPGADIRTFPIPHTAGRRHDDRELAIARPGVLPDRIDGPVGGEMEHRA